MEKIELNQYSVGPGSITRECRRSNPSNSPKLEEWNGKVRRGREDGFTLIEILLALTIFSISFLALAAGATTVMKSNKTSYMSTIATNLAQDKLEELMATNVASITASTDTPAPVDGVVFERSWFINDIVLPGLRRIQVQVDWGGHRLTVTSAVDL